MGNHTDEELVIGMMAKPLGLLENFEMVNQRGKENSIFQAVSLGMKGNVTGNCNIWDDRGQISCPVFLGNRDNWSYPSDPMVVMILS